MKQKETRNVARSLRVNCTVCTYLKLITELIIFPSIVSTMYFPRIWVPRDLVITDTHTSTLALIHVYCGIYLLVCGSVVLLQKNGIQNFREFQFFLTDSWHPQIKSTGKWWVAMFWEKATPHLIYPSILSFLLYCQLLGQDTQAGEEQSIFFKYYCCW